MRSVSRRGVAAIGLWLLLAGGLSGCESSLPTGTTGLFSPPAPAPYPNSPANAMWLIGWSYDHESLDHYRQILADDFRFACGPADSTEGGWLGVPPWARYDEIAFFTHLFFGGGASKPVNRVRFAIDRNFLVFPDPDAPWDPTGRWHRSIRARITMTVLDTHGGIVELQGMDTFSFVRGDSAQIPEELQRQGVVPDSLVWYLRRWEDETGSQCQLRAAYWTPRVSS